MDFVNLIGKDKEELDIHLSEEEIISIAKWCFRKQIKEKLKFAAFSYLVNENSKREKIKNTVFEDLKISEYLKLNKRTSLSNFIFSVRSKTIDFKQLQPWKYNDMLCVKYNLYPETLELFSTCSAYGKS